MSFTLQLKGDDRDGLGRVLCGAIKVSEASSQDWRLQRAVVQYLELSVEVDKNVFQERISERMHDKLSREYLQCGIQLWRYWMILCLLKSCEAEKRC